MKKEDFPRREVRYNRRRSRAPKEPAGQAIAKAFERLDEENVAHIHDLLNISAKSKLDPFAQWNNSELRLEETIVLFPFGESRTPEKILHYMECHLLSRLTSGRRKELFLQKPTVAQAMTTKLFLRVVLKDLKETATTSKAAKPIHTKEHACTEAPSRARFFIQEESGLYI